MSAPVPEQEDDFIDVVWGKSEFDEHISDFFTWQKATKFKRVIPFPAKIVLNDGFNGCAGKLRGKDCVSLHFTIDTGITLRYKKREWREETAIEIELPFKVAENLAEGIIRTVKRCR